VSDLALAGGWCALLVSGLAGVVLLRRFGLARTHARDLLHVGAGVWVLGWASWRDPLPPIAITVAAAALTAALPWAAGRWLAAARLRDAVSDDDERWSGLTLYTAAYALLTAVGLLVTPLPAAAALLALSLGDGIGGAVGRGLGRHHFRAPGGKRKSLEGSLTVAVMAAAGAVVAALAVGAPPTLAVALTTGAVASVAEALAPRGTDNAVVPVCVWAALVALGT